MIKDIVEYGGISGVSFKNIQILILLLVFTTLIMDRFPIAIIKDKITLSFEIADFALSDEGNHCKFEVFKDGKMIASFEPDNNGFLHICKNNGLIDEETLHLIADKLEAMNI